MSSRMMPAHQIQAVKINIAVTVTTNLALFMFLVQVKLIQLNLLLGKYYAEMQRLNLIKLIRINKRNVLGITEFVATATRGQGWWHWLCLRGWHVGGTRVSGWTRDQDCAEHHGDSHQSPVLLYLQWLLLHLLLLQHQWSRADQVEFLHRHFPLPTCLWNNFQSYLCSLIKILQENY